MTGFAVGVVIPACNEADTIGATIGSVHVALHAAGIEQSSVVVVADGCTDDTAGIAAAVLRPHDAVIEVTRRCVGAARRLGSDVALDTLATAPGRCWLLSIDADSTAPRGWAERHLAHAERGVECVAGVVALPPTAPRELDSAFAHRYRGGVGVSEHRHVHGTNLGIRADTLADAGGWPPLATGEDHALWQAVGALGRRRVQDPSIVVLTSDRLVGRAPAGFAHDLQRLAIGSGS